MNYLRFFFGTPQRAIWTLMVLGLLAVVEQHAPGVVSGALYNLGVAILTTVLRLLTEFFGPLAGALLPLIIAGIGLRVIVKGFSGGRSRRR